MLQAGIVQHLAIQRHLLEVRAFALHDASQGLAIAELQGPLWNQGGMEQVVALACIGVEAHHVEGEPGGHGSTVVVAREAIGLVGIVRGDNLAHTV